MGMQSILIDTYTINTNTVAYENTGTNTTAMVLLMQLSNDSPLTNQVRMWIDDGAGNTQAVYIPNMYSLLPWQIISDAEKHAVPPGHRIMFRFTELGTYVELTIRDNLR